MMELSSSSPAHERITFSIESDHALPSCESMPHLARPNPAVASSHSLCGMADNLSVGTISARSQKAQGWLPRQKIAWLKVRSTSSSSSTTRFQACRPYFSCLTLVLAAAPTLVSTMESKLDSIKQSLLKQPVRIVCLRLDAFGRSLRSEASRLWISSVPSGKHYRTSCRVILSDVVHVLSRWFL